MQSGRLILQALAALLFGALLYCAGMALLSLTALAISFAPYISSFGHPPAWHSASWVAATAVLFWACRTAGRLVGRTRPGPFAERISRLATGDALEIRTPQRLWLPVAWAAALSVLAPVILLRSFWPGLLQGALFVAAFAAPVAIAVSLGICARRSQLRPLSFLHILKVFLAVAAVFAFATPALLSILVIASVFTSAPLADGEGRRLAGAVLVPIGAVIFGAPVGLVVGLPLAALAGLAGSLVAFRRKPATP